MMIAALFQQVGARLSRENLRAGDKLGREAAHQNTDEVLKVSRLQIDGMQGSIGHKLLLRENP